MHDDPDGHEIVDLLERAVPLLHLAVDRPEVLGTPGHLEVVQPGRPERRLQGHPQTVDHLAALVALGLDLLRQRAIVVGLEELEREVLQLGLDSGHAEAVRQRRIDLAGLPRDPPPTLFGEVLEGAHVVEPVRQLHHDHAHVLRDRQQELAIVLRLFLRRRAKPEARDLGEPVDDVTHLVPEELADLIERHLGVLGHVVQQRRRDGHRVELLVHQDPRHLDRVRDEVVARETLLPPVRAGAEREGALHQPQVEPVGPLFQGLGEFCVDRGQCARHSNPASAKLKYESPPMIT